LTFVNQKWIRIKLNFFSNYDYSILNPLALSSMNNSVVQSFWLGLRTVDPAKFVCHWWMFVSLWVWFVLLDEILDRYVNFADETWEKNINTRSYFSFSSCCFCLF